MQILTNNPKIFSWCPGVKWIPGGPLEVLEESRKMVHEGYPLITHPLMGDIHLLTNPFRTVILGDKGNGIHILSLRWIEASIEKARTVTFMPKDKGNLEDYETIDFELFKTVMNSAGSYAGADG